MASLSFVRPGRNSERQYLGDLAGLLDRQRRRCGIALTPESFAADLAAQDSLRSGLFTLCNAISHMGESDLSAEELLPLVARALGGPDTAEGESGAEIPASMREAFLNGFTAWQNRLAPRDADDQEIWPPAQSPHSVLPADNAAAIAPAGMDPAITTPGRRTVQEALSLVRREHGVEPAPLRSGANGEDLGSMTLSELKSFLADIEHRVSRLSPHLEQLSALNAAAAPHSERADSDSVIPFPGRRKDQLTDPKDFDIETFIRHQPAAADSTAPRMNDAFVVSHAAAPDDRPRGIDALLAAAPVWANASPTARDFDEEAFVARHAYLSPTRRPGTFPAAPVYVPNGSALPLPPPDILPPVQFSAPIQFSAPVLTMAPPVPLTLSAPPLIGLDEESDPLLSPLDKFRAATRHLSTRRIFSLLASLTIFAGGLAGVIAYNALHSGSSPQFKDIAPPVRFGTPGMPAPPVTQGAAQNASLTAAAPSPRPATQPQAVSASRAAAPHSSDKWRIHPTAPHETPVAVWPLVPQQLATQPAMTVHTVTPPKAAPGASAAAAAAASSGPLYVPAPTMIGYALASPQPMYPSAQPRGITGTVAVEVMVSRLGDVTSAHAVSGPAELRSAAVSAVHGWHFRPYTVDGKASEVETTLQFYFKGN